MQTAFIKKEREELTIEEPLSVKREYTEQQTGLMPLKKEQDFTEMDDNDQLENHHDLRKCTQTERTSSQKTSPKRKPTSPVSCSQCGKSFDRKKKLDVHMTIHTGEKPFSCQQCGKSFTQKGNLKVHMGIHTGENSVSCQQCGKSFTQKINLKVHMRIHTGEKPYSCGQCGQSFTHKNNLNAHMRSHSGQKMFMCGQCGTRFTRKGGLENHMRIHTGEKPFKCGQCGRRFTRKASLGTHMKIHTGEKPFPCDQCRKSFRRKVTLDSHKRIHTGERPFVCFQCGKSFRFTGNLNQHMRIHSNKRTHNLNGFKCLQRGGSFRDFRNHLLTKEKAFMCRCCGKSFTNSRNLKLHTGKKPFKCLEKSFTHLKNPLPGRSGKRWLNCDQRDKTFILASHLQIHLKSHADFRPYLCCSCGKRFQWLSNLKWHQIARICVKARLRSHNS
ncbi:uncharacterized protein si:cabz01054394.5 isoform X2 [Danio rerio]|uniref:Gastrula zinc finger protein XlCGF57.1-like n=8 Tax=Danio rerio TaxID=7955 RepID=E7F7L9_DANRE|nr:zinc finger protein OZF-like [Danio rerio]XP_021330973.1 zinc finger protein OZF-like [Danio rerio]|eukprot:XP_009299258.1 zinc finger protein OZF-like [Danio rerio]